MLYTYPHVSSSVPYNHCLPNDCKFVTFFFLTKTSDKIKKVERFSKDAVSSLKKKS